MPVVWYSYSILYSLVTISISIKLNTENYALLRVCTINIFKYIKFSRAIVGAANYIYVAMTKVLISQSYEPLYSLVGNVYWLCRQVYLGYDIYIETEKISMELIDQIGWCYKPFDICDTQLSSLLRKRIAGAAVPSQR